MSTRLLVATTATLELPLDQAATAVLDIQDGPSGRVFLLGDKPLPVTGGPDRYTVTRDGYRLRVDIDRPRRTIAVQGGWWYRGEYTLDPDGEHTRLTHRVYNVAGPATRWAVPLANRLFIGFRAQIHEAFAHVVRDLGTRLGCHIRLNDRD